MHALLLLTLVSDDTYSFETPVLSQNLKTYEKKVYIPQLLKKIQYVVEGQQKYPNNIKVQNKEKKTNIDQIWQSQIKEIAVSLRQVEMQYEVSKFDASSSKYDAAQSGLS